MVSIPCPTCGLPRAADLIDAACPVCGGLRDSLPGEPEPIHDQPWVIPETKPAPAELSRGLPGWLYGFAAGIAVSLTGVISWPAVHEWLETRTTVEVAQKEPIAEPLSVEIAPFPRERMTAFRIPAPAEPVDEKRSEEPQPELVAGPLPEPAPRNPFRPEAPRALLLDHAQHYSPHVPPGSTVTIRGWVKTLIVRDLVAGAVLDCSELQAEEVVVVGKVDGGARLTLRAPGGSIVFRGKIDGRSRVDVRAPGGTVTFETPSDKGHDGAKIDGDSTVEVTARAVAFHGRIQGGGTKVFVTLTANASLKFAEIDGGARLEYSKTDPDDADPAISKGRIGSGTLTYVE
jgi:hypothetical protein